MISAFDADRAAPAVARSASTELMGRRDKPGDGDQEEVIS